MFGYLKVGRSSVSSSDYQIIICFPGFFLLNTLGQKCIERCSELVKEIEMYIKREKQVQDDNITKETKQFNHFKMLPWKQKRGDLLKVVNVLILENISNLCRHFPISNFPVKDSWEFPRNFCKIVTWLIKLC